MDDTSISEYFWYELLQQSIAFVFPQDDRRSAVEMFTLDEVVTHLSVK